MTAPCTYNGDSLQSGQFADRLFQDFPGLVAVFALPFRIEAGSPELFAERRHLGLVEDQTLAGQFFPDGDVELLGIRALLDGRGVDVLGDDSLDVIRQRLPGPA